MNVLAPGGSVVIVDDMPEEAAEPSADLETFKAGWQCPVLLGAHAYREVLRSAGLKLVVDLDLTSSVRPRSFSSIRLLEAFNRTAHLLVRNESFRQVMASHRGGLALERLNRRGLVRYRMLVACPP